MRRLFGADSLRSNNAESARAAAAQRRHYQHLRRLFGADSRRSDNAEGARAAAALRPRTDARRAE
jgi:hypothetical protein